MRKIILALLLIVTLIACKSSKRSKVVTKKSNKTTKIVNKDISSINSDLADKIIKQAKAYNGVRYKYGGTTNKGMDCSGLIYTAFQKEQIQIPRTSSSMAKDGTWIDLKEVQKGDLLFFATKKNSRNVNHVGLVVTSTIGNVEFIHSTTSQGVIISNLAERYWYFAFVQARRVL